MMGDQDKDADTKVEQALRKVTLAFAVLVTLAGAAYFAFAIWVVARDWETVLTQHFAAIIGLPGAAAVAFVIVVFLRQTEGPIEFEGLGFKVKGAAGQVLMWVICFLALIGAIKLLW